MSTSETKKKDEQLSTRANEKEKEDEIELLSAPDSSRNNDMSKKNPLMSSSSTIESYNSQKENINEALLKPVRSQVSTSRRHVVAPSKNAKNKYNSCGDESITHSASSHTLEIQSERATGAVCCRVDLSDRAPSRNEKSEPRRLVTSSSAS